jgi:O-antigen/teichoic acid export membrane protein
LIMRNNNDLSVKIFNATKWSTVTEMIAKLIVPVTNMILARILVPEAFGVVATVTMIISFAEMLTDAGFQKYIIQREFDNETEKFQTITVAFWTNLVVSIILATVIAIYSESIATLVGNPGLGDVIILACVSLPLTSFSSIQMAVYRRNFNYKTLFYTRIISVFIPFVVTIPLAVAGFSYWSLIIGTICGNIVSALVLNFKSVWKPKFYYSFSILKKMLSFSLWSLVESVSIWLTSYIDIFIMGGFLNLHYLGLYKTSMTTVNGIMAIFTTSTTSVLFSALSRLQHDDSEFYRIFLKFLRIIGIFILPMGMGIFIYRDLVTNIILGNQWNEVSLFVGLWGLMSSITIVLGQYCSEVYRSKGRPKISLLVQLLHLMALIPTIIISVRYGFIILIYARSLIKIQQIIVNLFIMYVVFKISPWVMIRNFFPPIICTLLMGVEAYLLLRVSSTVIWEVTSIIICIFSYFTLILLFPKTRIELMSIVIRLSKFNHGKLKIFTK